MLNRSFKLEPRRILLALALVLFPALMFMACGAKQDPLDGRSEYIDKALPPGQFPQKPLPDDEKYLKIDVENTYTFYELEENELQIGGRVLKQINGKDAVIGKDFDVFIDNIAEFPGAVYDPATRKFRWTPPHLSGGSDKFNQKPMIIKLRCKCEPEKSKTERVNILVVRKEIDPEVLAIEPSTVEVREGSFAEFTVKVKDPDTATEVGSVPNVYALPGGRYDKNLAQFIKRAPDDTTRKIKNPTQDPKDPTIWYVKMRIELDDSELSASTTNFSISIEAVSRFGRRANKNMSVRVQTRVRKPLIGWNKDVNFYAGQQNSMSFVAYDPYYEGDVTAKILNCGTLIGATCSCAHLAKSQQVCTISWNLPANAQAASVPVRTEVVNKSPIWGDTTTEQASYTAYIRVIPMATPTPPPPPPTATPAPTPTPAPTAAPTPEEEPENVPRFKKMGGR